MVMFHPLSLILGTRFGTINFEHSSDSLPCRLSSCNYHKENVHFVPIPPFLGISFGTAPEGSEGPTTLLHGNVVQNGQQKTNGTHPYIHGGVTLILGGPGQVVDQKH